MPAGEVHSGATVEVRAFRGGRRSSVYVEHVLPEKAFRRIREAGTRKGLALISSLGPDQTHELDKRQARRLALEATALRTGGELVDLDDDLAAIVEVTRWCARSSTNSWLTIAGPG
jgi:hypothetical protein